MFLKQAPTTLTPALSREPGEGVAAWLFKTLFNNLIFEQRLIF
jgi:hypothetical protein